MQRYYFDIHDGDVLVPDEEGLELADLARAEIEAAESLVGLMKDRSESGEIYHFAVEVRTTVGPVFKVGVTFELRAAQ